MRNPIQLVPFFSNGSNGLIISATASSSSTAMVAPSAPLDPVFPTSVRIYNKGTDLIFFNTSKGPGSASATSPNTDKAVPEGNTEIFSVPDDHDHINIICASSTATVYVMPGWGS